MPKFAYILVTPDGVDQICETEEDMLREGNNLVDNHCPVAAFVVDWEDQDMMVDSLNEAVNDMFFVDQVIINPRGDIPTTKH